MLSPEEANQMSLRMIDFYNLIGIFEYVIEDGRITFVENIIPVQTTTSTQG